MGKGIACRGGSFGRRFGFVRREGLGARGDNLPHGDAERNGNNNTPVKLAFRAAVDDLDENRNPMAYANMNPRLRMITLYNYAQRKNYLVCGTGNLSERTMGYFTKWGDGAFDFNPIGDLTVREIYKLLTYAECPEEIIKEPPSAALFEGQTDEQELGITYEEIDEYLLNGNASEEARAKIEAASKRAEHKRTLGRVYPK